MGESIVDRVAIAISGAPFPTAKSRGRARKAIEAMRNPPDRIVAAVEQMAEERYRASPEMQRWYGDDVWNAGIDAALAETET